MPITFLQDQVQITLHTSGNSLYVTKYCFAQTERLNSFKVIWEVWHTKEKTTEKCWIPSAYILWYFFFAKPGLLLTHNLFIFKPLMVAYGYTAAIPRLACQAQTRKRRKSEMGHKQSEVTELPAQNGTWWQAILTKVKTEGKNPSDVWP